MVAILLADTDSRIRRIVKDVENMCRSVGWNILVHHEGEDLDEILDSVDGNIIAFSPCGKLTLDGMIKKYGDEVVIVVGGFTEGDFRSDVYSRADATVSLGHKLLPIPQVIELIINAYEKKAEGRGGGDRQGWGRQAL